MEDEKLNGVAAALSADAVAGAVYAAVRHCATHLRPDVLAAMQTARADETQARALSVLDCLLENAHIGQTDGVPICQDTGTCWVRLEIGEELSVPGNILSRVNDAVARAYTDGRLRMSVLADALLDRTNTGDNTPAFAEVAFRPGCGYTLRAAQELGFAFPDCRLHFYETPVTPVDKRYFDYEAFNGNGIGWGIDTVLATMLHCMRFWGTERLALPPEKAKKAPDVNMIRQMLLNGYALYYPYPDMWEYLDVNSRQGLALCRQRRLELFGTDDTEYPRRKGTLQYIEKRLKTHIGRLIDEKASEFAAKALHPSSFR